MTTIEAPTGQHMDALHYAQSVRLAIAQEKTRVHGLPPAERVLEVQAVLRAEDLPGVYPGMRVCHLLGCLHRVGPGKQAWLVGRLRLSSGDRKLRELTLRQRRMLADLIGSL